MREVDAGRVDLLMFLFPLYLQLLWDLELLTGAGLGLFWPPWARFCSQRDRTQHVWSQYSQSWGRSVDGDFEQLVSGLSRERFCVTLRESQGWGGVEGAWALRTSRFRFLLYGFLWTLGF